MKHVVIVGAGVIGLSTAYYCCQRGWRVTVIDRGGERRDGCSFGNAGMVVPSHFTPLASPGLLLHSLRWMWNPESPFRIRPRLDAGLLGWGFRFCLAANGAHVARSSPVLCELSLASRALFQELAALPGNDFGWSPRGLLMLCRETRTLEEEAKAAVKAQQLGLQVEVLDRRQAAAAEPDLQMDVAGAVLYPQDCHLAPERFVNRLQDLVREAGGRCLWNSEVTGWQVQGRRVLGVRTSADNISADEVVLCGGAWSSALLRAVGLRLPMQAGKGYSLTLANPAQRPQRCAILTEARVAVTPIGSSLRFGGTMEIAGLDETIDPARVRGIVRSATQYYPGFHASDFDGIKPWCGLRPVSPDGLPYLGRTSRLENLVIATGHAMMGLSLAPITGKLVADILSNERTAVDIRLLDPDRHG